MAMNRFFFTSTFQEVDYAFCWILWHLYGAVWHITPTPHKADMVQIVAIHDTAKRGDKSTLEPFTVILSSPYFAVSECSKPKIIQ